MTTKEPTLARTVAIDGPAGVGKSTVARLVAEGLGLSYLDTGAMYRAVALVGRDRGVDPEDTAALADLVDDLPIRLEPDGEGVARISIDGEDVESRIRTSEVGLLASSYAQQGVVRRFLVRLQQDFGRRFGAVLEGRDIGTVVFPETPHKFFLDARPEIRAERRANQQREQGRAADRDAILADILKRDARDRGREDSPLRSDDSYHLVDTSDLPLEAVVDYILERIRGASP